MTFAVAIDRFIEDLRGAGRINSPASVRAYRDVIGWHAEDADTDDPRHTTPEDVLRTLARWSHPNTKANRHAILTSFYAWMVRRGHRKDNPADRIERARKRKADPLRMRRDEALAVLSACETTRERRVVYLALLEGVRNQELRRLKGRHFDRPGLIRVAPEVAKGGRPRWLPVLAEAQPVVDEIRANVARDDHVVPAQRRDPNRGIWFDLPDRQCSGQAVWRLVRRVAERAGVESTPHAL